MTSLISGYLYSRRMRGAGPLGVSTHSAMSMLFSFRHSRCCGRHARVGCEMGWGARGCAGGGEGQQAVGGGQRGGRRGGQAAGGEGEGARW